MIRKTLKKRPQTSSMINFEDFVHIRSQKEKNPFEQNWKKAIVMDELLALYKPQIGGVPPASTNCSKSQYIVQYPLHFNNENQDINWNNNEQSQLNKYYKMTDGINRWQQMFQNDHIEQAACKIQKRIIYNRKPNIVQIQVQNKKNQLKKKRIHQHYSSSSLTGFSNLLKDSQSNLKNKRQQLQKLHKIALKQYGLNFKENSHKNQIQFNLQEYKRKDRQIFDKFMDTMPRSPKISQKQSTDIINSNIPQSIQLKRGYPHSVGSSPMRQINLPKSAQCSRKKHYVRILCD